ncbi:hypothetical protein LCGC14_0297510 [marine sediment metagenome]|uniref:Uncharacterized protein n=1 Tax=marine sediment metagenome TaxID=412755 RepID=A0A0F9WWY7_9ZZZZ
MGDNFGKRIDLFGRQEETRSYLRNLSMIEPPKPLELPRHEKENERLSRSNREQVSQQTGISVEELERRKKQIGLASLPNVTEETSSPSDDTSKGDTTPDDPRARLADAEAKINQLVQFISDQREVSVPQNADLERSYELEGAEITEIVPGDGIDVDNPAPGQFIVSLATKFLEEEEATDSDTDLDNDQGTHDNPLALAIGVSANADVDEPQTDTWNRNSQGVNDGFTMAFHRSAYSDTGDEVFHGDYRVVTFDSQGKAVSVTLETEYTVDAPEDCDIIDGGTW